MSGSPGLPALASVHTAPVRPAASQTLEPADLSPAPGPLPLTPSWPETLLPQPSAWLTPSFAKMSPLSETSTSSLRDPHLPVPVHAHSHLLVQCLLHALSGSRDVVYCHFTWVGTSAAAHSCIPCAQNSTGTWRAPHRRPPSERHEEGPLPLAEHSSPHGEVPGAGPPRLGQPWPAFLSAFGELHAGRGTWVDAVFHEGSGRVVLPLAPRTPGGSASKPDQPPGLTPAATSL